MLQPLRQLLFAFAIIDGTSSQLARSAQYLAPVATAGVSCDVATMTAPVKAMPAQDGVYSFEVEPGMTGPWALHLAAKMQGEAETVRGTIDADLVK